MQRDVQVSRRRRVARALAVLLLPALAACTTTGQPEAIADPRHDTTTSTATSTSGTAPDADADEVVWQEFTGGGFVPTTVSGREVPDVTIYRDGRIFTKAEGTLGPPVALEQARVPSDELDAFLADATSTGLIAPTTDFGSPGVTDQPSTTVLLQAGDERRQIDVYALGFGGDLPAGDLSTEQADRRTALRELLARARSLAEDATPYVPDRVSATRVDPSVVIDPPAASPSWPGPPLSAFPPIDERTSSSCLVIEGADAAAVYRADQDNPDATWDVDGEVQAILIVPLLPGQEGCPPA